MHTPLQRLRRLSLPIIGSTAIASQAQAFVIGFDLDNISSTVAVANVEPEEIQSIPFRFPGMGQYDMDGISLIIQAGSGSSLVWISTSIADSAPGGSSMTFSSSQTTSGAAKVDFSPDGSYAITGGTTYYLHLLGFRSGGSPELFKSAGAPATVTQDVSAGAASGASVVVTPATGTLAENDAYGFHTRGATVASGASPQFENSIGNTGLFSITATAVPEAGTALSAMAGAAFLLGVGMRRRRKAAPQTAGKA